MRQSAPRLLLTLALGLAACPKLPPVAGCRPLAQRCQNDQPEVCSQTQRWHVVGDQPCSAVPGQTCRVSDGGVASCVRAPAAACAGPSGCPTDGGAL